LENNKNYSVTFLESNMPVPIAKKTISGINLYGAIMKEENPWIRGDDKSMPNIKNIIESACTMPLLEA